jgi:FixJ family two-component response regulator
VAKSGAKRSAKLQIVKHRGDSSRIDSGIILVHRPQQAMEQTSRVFVIDDDASVLKALERLLRAHGIAAEGFTSADAFFERPAPEGAACLLLDLRLGATSGLDVQTALARRGVVIPIVFLSGQGDVPSTARAMREGAVDFLVKPVDEVELMEAVHRGLAQSVVLNRKRAAERAATERLARLTKREREVCELVARGLLNKQIAYELGTSEKTVKVHRGRVMDKLQVESVADLVRLLSSAPPSAINSM